MPNSTDLPKGSLKGTKVIDPVQETYYRLKEVCAWLRVFGILLILSVIVGSCVLINASLMGF